VGRAGPGDAAVRAGHRWYRASGGGDGALLTRCLLAAVAAEQDDQTVIAGLQTVLEEARRHHDLETQTLALDSLARAAAAGGDLPGAARLLEEPTACTPRSGTPWTTPTAWTRGPPARP
jgi:hypothetical protein